MTTVGSSLGVADPSVPVPVVAPRAGTRAALAAWWSQRRPPALLIRWKLTIFYSAVLAFTLMSFSVMVYVYMSRSLLGDIDRASQERAAQVAAGLVIEARREAVLGILDQRQAAILRASGLLKPFEPWRYEGVGIRYYDAFGQLAGASDAFLMDRKRVPIDYNLVISANHGREHRVLVNAPSAGGAFYSYSRPVLVDKQPWATVEILTSMQSYYSTMNRLARLLIAGMLLATTLAFFTGAVVTEAALRPLDKIARTAQQIYRERDLSRRIRDQGPADEIGRLATTFNAMLDQIENMFDRQRQFLADVSHELRTPLTTIRGEVELMQRTGRLDPEGLDAVRGEAERMSRMVGDLMLLVRTNEEAAAVRDPVALDAVIADAHRQAQRLVGEGHSVAIRRAEPLAVVGDGDQLKQLVLNLVSNAVKHTPPGTRVTLDLYRDGDWACLVVADDGPGIPPEDLPYIFDRFYRVDKARARSSGGTGLGLAIVHAIATSHGGSVVAESAPGQGTRFTVRLPRANGAKKA
jgi:two-component system OmpR family sensor kinase